MNMEFSTVRVAICVVVSLFICREVFSEDTYTPIVESECYNTAVEVRTNDDTLGIIDGHSGTFDFNTNNGDTFDFEKPSWKTDFVLIVEGQKLYVTKAVLALASTVFEHKFSLSGDEKEMELPGKSVDAVKDFLRRIYPLPLSALTPESAERILHLVHEFEVTDLKSRCENVLIRSIDYTTDVYKLLELLSKAHEYKLENLSEKCVDLAAFKPPHEIKNAGNKHLVPAEAMVKVLEKYVFLVQNTVETYYNYINKQYSKSRQHSLNNDFWEGRTLQFELPYTPDALMKQHITLHDERSIDVTIYTATIYKSYLFLFSSPSSSIFIKIDSSSGDHQFKLLAPRVVFVNRTPDYDDLAVDIDALGEPKELVSYEEIRSREMYESRFVENDMLEILVYLLILKQ